jgi:arylsulfatase A-like enzyme
MPGPNILWIVTTQWRAQACGFAGDPDARTPHLDRWAAEGIFHSAAVTPHPFGPFARAALLTGLPSPANGVRDYWDALPADRETIAHRMRRRGYTTAFFGKWHLGERDPAAPLVGEAHARTLVPAGRRGGFDYWEGFESGFLLNDPWLHGTDLPEPRQFLGYQSDVLVDRAGAWLERAGPWFGVLSLEPPHPPYAAPAAGVARRDPAALRLRANVPPAAEAQARVELAGYHAHLEATDRALGRLLARLDGARTLVVFTSVHGDMLGSQGCFRKGWPYEESVRVPLVVRLPRGEGRGIEPEPVSLVELGAWTEAWAEGRRPRPTGAPAAISMPAVVALPWQCDRVWSGWRSRTRKEVFLADGRPWLAFDLEHDPQERWNLVAEGRRSEAGGQRSEAGGQTSEDGLPEGGARM